MKAIDLSLTELCYYLTISSLFHPYSTYTVKKKYVLREILNGHAPTIISQPRPIHNSITQIYSLTWFWWMNGKSNISSRSVQARVGCVSHSPFSPIVFFLFRPTMTAKGESSRGLFKCLKTNSTCLYPAYHFVRGESIRDRSETRQWRDSAWVIAEFDFSFSFSWCKVFIVLCQVTVS